MFVIDMMPQPQSGDTGTDSEPNVAVNPVNPEIIAASAFTRDPDPNATHAPIYVSVDGGQSWRLASIVPDADGITADITLRFSRSNHLYVSHLSTGGDVSGDTMVVSRTSDLTFNSPLSVISTVTSADQPYIEATTVEDGPDTGMDRVYVGFTNGFASLHYSFDAAAPNPQFHTVQIETRNGEGVGYNLPQVRTAIHSSGVIYSTFYSVLSGVIPPAGTHLVNVVVVRDDKWGKGNNPFTVLTDADQKAGRIVVPGTPIADSSQFGHERTGGELSIAVDPANADRVYLAWADQTAGAYTLHVSRSDDGGKTWSSDLRTIPWAQNPALAVDGNGTVGFLYQQYVVNQKGARWVTHFQTSLGGLTWTDRTLADVPADTPEPYGATYIGDYVHLMAVKTTFYGVFSANNTPDPTNFPSATPAYQRNKDFASKTLFDVDGTTPVDPSIDAFFFKAEQPRPFRPQDFVAVAEIIFGVIHDGGGGIQVGPNFVPLPPWSPDGPFRGLAAALAEYFDPAATRDELATQALRDRFAASLRALQNAAGDG